MQTPPHSAARRPPREHLVALVAGAVVWLLFLDFPEPPVGWLDASWQLSLVDAHLHGRQFGTDIVFTFGPWGFLTSHFYLPDAIGAKLLWELGAKLLLAVGLVALTADLAPWRRWVSLGALACFGWLFPDTFYAVYLTFAVLLGLFRPGDHWWKHALLAGSLAFLAQIKFTYFLLAAAGIALSTVAALATPPRRASALAPAVGFVGAFLVFWIAGGQGLLNLPRYLSLSWEISQGYPGAMALDETWTVFLLGAAALVAGLGIIARHAWSVAPGLRWSAWPAAAFALGAWWLAWKHGFTRADGHVLGFFYFALVIGLALPAGVPAGASGRHWLAWVPLVSLAGIFVSDPGLGRQTPRLLWERVSGNSRQLAGVFSLPETFRQRTEAAQARSGSSSLRAIAGRSTVDSITYEQGSLLADGLDYLPRPVVQSYSAYTPRLMRENLAHYRSDRAPGIVALNLVTIDGRLPSQDDALLLAELPRLYELAEETPDRLLLRRKAAVPSPSRREALQTNDLALGTDVTLPPAGGHALWFRGRFPLTMLGRLRAFLYKPPVLRLVVTDSEGGSHNYRVIPAIAREGFLIGPLLNSNAAYAAFIRGEGHRTIQSLRFEPAAPHEAEFWRPAHLEFHRLPDLPIQWVDPMKAYVARRITNIAPLAIQSGLATSFISVEATPALLVHAPGEMTFVPPATATRLEAAFGMREGAYSAGGQTDGAEFLVEGVHADGRTTILWRRVLNPLAVPGDRGLQRLTLTLPAGLQRLVLRTAAGAAGNSNWDWTYWGGINLMP